MKILKFLDDKLELYLSIFLMAVLALDLGVQVFMRYIAQASLSWSEELARYTFVWLVYISISLGAKHMRHIKIDAGLMCFPKAWRKYVVILGDICFFVFAVIVIFLAYNMVQRQLMMSQLSPAMRMPMWMVYAAPMVGFALTAFRQVQTIIYRIRHLNDPEDAATALQ